jgi:NAD-dependent SIR2 family protein deacetylase
MSKTIFIIGAGMSAECGAPVIRDFLKPDYLEMIPSKQRSSIKKFLNSNYFSNDCITIEDALKKIDTEIKNEVPTSRYSIEQLIKIRKILVNYIIEILSICGDNLMKELRAEKCDSPYLVLSSNQKNRDRLFQQKTIDQLTRELENFSGIKKKIPIIGINAKKWVETYSSILLLMKPNDVVINLNFDQFFELALLDLPLDVTVDFGIEFFELSADEDVLCNGILSKITRPPNTSNLRKISLFKIHGSLNWGICSECKSLISTVRTPIIRVKKYIRDLQKEDKKFKRNKLCCEKFAIEPSIVVPTIYSQRGYDNKYLREISKAVISEITTADNLVFLGYSLSDSDKYIRNLFKKAKKLKKGKPWDHVYVINRSITKIKKNYESIFENAEFVRSTTSKYIDDELMRIDGKKITVNNCIMKRKPVKIVKI